MYKTLNVTLLKLFSPWGNPGVDLRLTMRVQITMKEVAAFCQNQPFIFPKPGWTETV
jgi:hypothetical protein